MLTRISHLRPKRDEDGRILCNEGLHNCTVHVKLLGRQINKDTYKMGEAFFMHGEKKK